MGASRQGAELGGAGVVEQDAAVGLHTTTLCVSSAIQRGQAVCAPARRRRRSSCTCGVMSARRPSLLAANWLMVSAANSGAASGKGSSTRRNGGEQTTLRFLAVGGGDPAEPRQQMNRSSCQRLRRPARVLRGQCRTDSLSSSSVIGSLSAQMRFGRDQPAGVRPAGDLPFFICWPAMKGSARPETALYLVRCRRPRTPRCTPRNRSGALSATERPVTRRVAWRESFSASDRATTRWLSWFDIATAAVENRVVPSSVTFTTGPAEEVTAGQARPAGSQLAEPAQPLGTRRSRAFSANCRNMCTHRSQCRPLATSVPALRTQHQHLHAGKRLVRAHRLAALVGAAAAGIITSSGTRSGFSSRDHRQRRIPVAPRSRNWTALPSGTPAR